MNIHKYKNYSPQIDDSCYLAPSSAVIGEVTIGKNSSVWFNTVIRGDVAKISIGENTNIQDGSILHCKSGVELCIGNNVTVGHGVVLHSCAIDDGCLIGMGAIVLDEAKIGKGCLIAAGTLVTPRMVIPENSVVMGNPARVKRELTDEERKYLKYAAAHYVGQMREYKNT